jgi:hypothetical protein
VIRALALVAALVVPGCLGSVVVSSGPDGGNHGMDGGAPRLEITDLLCMPDVTSGAHAQRGQWVECTFRVAGGQGDLAYACGEPFDCRPGAFPPSDVEILVDPLQPDGLYDLSLLRVDTRNLDANVEVTIVVRDGTALAQRTVSMTIEEQDAQPSPTALAVACDGERSAAYTVRAGDTLACVVYYGDPDLEPNQRPPVVVTPDGVYPHELIHSPSPDPDPRHGVSPWWLNTTVDAANQDFGYAFSVPASPGTPPVHLTVQVTPH